MMRSVLGGLSKTANNPAYNIVFHLSPEKKHSKQCRASNDNHRAY